MSHLEEIARRRSKNTGEPFSIALQKVNALHAVIERAIDRSQAWLPAWLAASLAEDSQEVVEEGERWIRSRPPELASLLFRFPPQCLVRPRAVMICPAPGTTGLVVSYLPPSEKLPRGALGVIQSPEGPLRAECEPDDLEFVRPWRGWTRERIGELLS